MNFVTHDIHAIMITTARVGFNRFEGMHREVVGLARSYLTKRYMKYVDSIANKPPTITGEHITEKIYIYIKRNVN